MSDPFRPVPQSEGLNRREHDRRPLRVAVTVLIGEQTFEFRSLDISESGMAISAAANPRVGTQFRIAFALPRRSQGYTEISSLVTVMGSVLSNSDDGFRIGLRFVSLSQAMRSAIVEFVK